MKASIRRLFATTYVTGEPVEIAPALEREQPPAKSRRSATMIIAALLLAAVFLSAGGVYFFMKPTTLRVAVGPSGSDDARLVQTIAQIMARDRSNVRLKITTTDGAVASAAALDGGSADIAVVRGDLNVPKSAQAVAILRKNLVVLWVPPAQKAEPEAAAKKTAPKTAAKKETVKPIEKIEDLVGKRIGVIGRTRANVDLLNVILEQYGVDPSKVSVVQFPTSEIAEAVRNAKADAFLAAGPISSRITQDAVAASSRGGAPTFLAIDSADAIAGRKPAYEATEISEGAFGSAPARPEEAVKTIGFNHYIVAAKSVPEQVVADFTRVVFNARSTISAELPNAGRIEAPDTDKDATLAAHPGAAAYIDGDEKTFFDRYSDLLYWGLMALSAVGSAGAWFASYLKRDDKSTAVGHRSHLLDMLQQARAAGSADELDQIQEDADRLLRLTLEAFDAGAIEDSALTAFSIVLDQTHAAIADRRAVLAMRSRQGHQPSPA